MNVNNVPPAGGPVIGRPVLEQAREPVGKTGPKKVGHVDKPVSGEETNGEPVANEENAESKRGVIRLLEAGHFKGVADVRLRLNFFEELSGRAIDSATGVATEEAGALADQVAADVEELIGQLEADDETRGAVDELVAAFEEGVQTALGEFASDGVLDRDGLADALGSAFASLVEQLRGVLAPPVDSEIPSPSEEASTDEMIGDTIDSPDEADSGLVEALALLTQSFEESLANLLASVEEASVLPPLSGPPAGNGQAYEKFLAMYEDLIGLTSSIPETEEPGEEGIEVTA